MTYRANFFLMILVECMFLLWKLLYTFIVSGTGVSLNGINSDKMFLFSGSFLLMTGIYLAFFFYNFSNIQQLVGEGALDLYMTKPVSLQFMVTLRNVDTGTPIPNILGGLVILIHGWRKAEIPVDFVHIAGYLLFFVCGLVTAYSVMLAPQLLSFILIRGSALREISDALWDTNSMPMTIYAKGIQFVGSYILPLFVISNYATMFILGRLTPLTCLWGLLAPVVFLFLVRLLWKCMLKHYSSASS
jgi:ABC-2 type transport system permease protein